MHAEKARSEGSDRAGRCGAMKLAACLLLGVFGSRAAAVINVPADQATIQAAIDAAPPGETIVVAPGVYNENIFINKANLTIRSSGGSGVTTIQSALNDTPVVRIVAPGVTLGGPLAGFRINQLDAGPAGAPFTGNCAIRVIGGASSSAVAPSTITIRNCIITGNQTDEGILVNDHLTKARLLVQECTFGKNGGAFGFRRAIYFHRANSGGGLNTDVSANECTIDLLNLTATDFQEAGIYFTEMIHKTAVTLLGGSFTGTVVAGYGLYAAGISNGSRLVIDGTSFASVNEGIQLDVVKNRSSLRCAGVTVSAFRDSGLEFEAVGGSQAIVSGSTFAGNGVTAGTGILSYTRASTATFENNTISGVDDFGLWLDTVSGSTVTAVGNVITMYTGGSGRGIHSSTRKGAQTALRHNIISGFDQAGIAEDYPNNGAEVIVESNQLTGAAAGAAYGIIVDYVEYGASAQILNNSIERFTVRGISTSSVREGSRLSVIGNGVLALPAGGDDGIYVEDVAYSSEATVRGNTVDGFRQSAITLKYARGASVVVADDNAAAAHATGARYGAVIEQVDDGTSVTISNNTIAGFGNVAGSKALFNRYVEDGGRLTVLGNTFTAGPAFSEFGFHSADGFSYGATAVVSGNTFSGFTDTGFFIDNLGYSGTLTTITDNVFTAASTGAGTGLYADDGLEAGAVGTIAGNTFAGFKRRGIFVYQVYYGSDLAIHGNLLTAMDGGTANQYGIVIESDVREDSWCTITGNRIDGIRDPDGAGFFLAFGIHLPGAWEGSTLTVADNVVNGLPGGTSYGILANYVADDGSGLEVLRNRVAGFTEASLYFYDDTKNGSRLLCNDNRLTGAKYGIFYDTSYDLTSGSDAVFHRNQITGFSGTGLLIGGRVWGCIIDIRSNRIIGSAAAAGISFLENSTAISSGAEVSVEQNCIGDAAEGLVLQKILDTAFVRARFNDFSGVTGVGIHNIFGDAAHRIDAENNFFGALAVPAAGEVDIDPALAAPPDEDGDGVTNCDDLCPDSPAGRPVDAQGCPYDNCPDDPVKFDPGICGCGVSDTDSDADGTADCLDGCPADPAKTAAGPCGCGIAELDTDGDTLPDCLDACPAVAGTPELEGCPPAGGDDAGQPPPPEAGEPPPPDAGQPLPPQCGAGVCGAGATLTMLPAMLGMALLRLGRRRRLWS